MLTCITRPKQSQPDDHSADNQPNAIKNLTSQIKDMAVKASGAYRSCNPCATQPVQPQQRRCQGSSCDSSDSVLSASSERFRWSYRRTVSSNSSSMTTTSGKKKLEARLKRISSGEGTPVSASGRRVDSVVFLEENEPKEWVAQVESGVLITFVSLPRGGNDLKRIRFSRETFNKWQAQRWWAENCEKVMELYNVERLNRQAFPLSTPPRSEDESSKVESIKDSPVIPPVSRESLPRAIQDPAGIGYSSSDSLERSSALSRHNYDSCGVVSTPKLNGGKTETSSVDASMRTSSSRDADRSGDISISNVSTDLGTECVEEDEPGVYITIRTLADGRREIRRVRFSREKFGEMHARRWWEENRARIHKKYL